MKTITIEFESDISDSEHKQLIEEIETEIKIATGKRGGILIVTVPITDSVFKVSPS